MRPRTVLCAALFLSVSAAAQARTASDSDCVLAYGNAAARCVKKYAATIGACRNRADAACETARRAGGRLEKLLGETDEPTRKACGAESAARLTFSLGVGDLVLRGAQACEAWAEHFLDFAYADDLAGLSPAARACQRRVAKQLRGLREKVVRAYGPRCYVPEAAGESCDRAARDARVTEARTTATARVQEGCGAAFDELALGAGTTPEARIDSVVARIADAARHLAEQVYPPLLAPAGLFGPHPVGVRTLELADPSRPRPIEPRALRTEVYYPADPGAVAGMPRDHLVVDGSDLGETPTYRDVSRAAGTFPLIVYSHGGGGARHESVFRLAHLASHGFVVVSADHGDIQEGAFDDAQFVNRPLDASFLLDQFLAFDAEPGHPLEGAIDPARIGGTGFSLGGYTVTTLAVGPFFRGTFTDPRIRAILPQDTPVGASSEHYAADAPALFSTIAIPTLALSSDGGGFKPGNQALFDALVPGPDVMGYGNLRGAIHFTFTDSCQFPGASGFECYPVSLPQRYAARIVGYLAVSFFDAVLNGDAQALARLQPAALAGIDDLTFQSK